MTEKSIFDLDPDQLDRLLSIGADADKEQSSNKKAAQADQGRVASEGGSASSGPQQSGDPTASLASVVERPGGWIGQYKLLSVLGEGGMGIVYTAEQERPIKRRVALKVIKPGMDSKRIVARFEAERQTLALLDHPNIAQVHDAGTADSGRPYFVMEYVKGMPITEFCDRHMLSIEDRLRLFQQVCSALQHAHQKGIIHRDIKPSNILVTSENDQAIPKIIDFGVAKALIQPLTERTLITEDSHLLGTPEYMSPEQIESANEDIDTRSDIYSLGVLLYELLTGVLPFDSDTLRTGGIENIRKVIRETDPNTPSTRLSKLGEKAVEIAQNRNIEIQTLKKHLRNELEWIPLKAMRKERSQRYRSASELSDDIDNYLKGEPLMAGPPTARYRLKKFIRRHKALVGGITAVLIVSIIGCVVSTYFALGQAKALAETQALANYLYDGILRPMSQKRNQILTARDVLGTATKNLEGKFRDYPLIEAEIRYHLGSAYFWGLNDDKAAEILLDRSFRITQEHLGPEHGFSNVLGLTYGSRGRFKEAAYVYERKLDRSPRLERDEPWRILGYINLANVYLAMGQYKDAEKLMVEGRNRFFPDEKDKPLMPLANSYLGQGRYEEAERDFLRLLEEGELNVWAQVSARSGLARIYMEDERYSDANELLVEAIEIGQRRLTGRGNMVTLSAMNSLALLRINQDDFDAADRVLTEALKIGKEKLGEDRLVVLGTINGLGVLRREQGQYKEAENLLRQALEGRRHKLGKDHPDCLESMHEIAVLHKDQKRFKDAERLMLEAVEGRRLKLGETHPHTIESMNNLIDLYEAWNKPEEGEEWRSKLLETETKEQ